MVLIRPFQVGSAAPLQADRVHAGEAEPVGRMNGGLRLSKR